MPRPTSVTVDRGIVTIDERRRFLNGIRLTPRGTSLSGSDVDGRSAALVVAATGANALVVEPDDATPDLLDAASDCGVLVLVDVSGIDDPRRRPAAAGVAGWFVEGRGWRPKRRADRVGPPIVSAPRPWALGWATGDERDLPDRMRRARRPPTALTGFGAPSVAATDAWFDDAGRTWRRLGEHDGPPVGERDLACLLRHTPPAAFDDPQDWAAATRAYQAMVIRFHVETARRLRYSPLGMVVPEALYDPAGGVSSALIGPDGTPKEALRALTDAYHPVTVIADRLPPHLHGHEALAIDVHVVNDLAEPLADASVVATLTWADGRQRYGFGGGAAPDSVQRVGTIPIVVPPVSGPLDLVIELRHGDAVVTRTYRSEIFADPHEH